MYLCFATVCLNGPIEFLLIQTWSRFNCSIVVVNLMLRSPHLLYLDCFSLVIGYHSLNEKNVLENCCYVMYYSEFASHFPEIVYGFKVLSVCFKSYCFVLVFIYYKCMSSLLCGVCSYDTNSFRPIHYLITSNNVV